MQALPVIDDVQYRVGAPRLRAVLNRCQIARGVQKSTVLLAHQKRRLVAVEKDAYRARAFLRNAFFLQIFHNCREAIVIKTLAVLIIELYVKPSVNPFDVAFALLANFLPKLEILRVIRVEFGGFVQYRIANARL